MGHLKGLAAVGVMVLIAWTGTTSCAHSAEAHGSAERGTASVPAREQLVGIWRLLDVEVAGPNGTQTDPFFQGDSKGFIIYETHGWMSVQIAALHRPRFKIPRSRRAIESKREVEQRAAAFDRYYAYVGTWSYDEANGLVTHHVDTSLIPAEDGATYSQVASIDGDRLTLTVRVGREGSRLEQRKIWQRVTRASRTDPVDPAR